MVRRRYVPLLTVTSCAEFADLDLMPSIDCPGRRCERVQHRSDRENGHRIERAAHQDGNYSRQADGDGRWILSKLGHGGPRTTSKDGRW